MRSPGERGVEPAPSFCVSMRRFTRHVEACAREEEGPENNWQTASIFLKRLRARVLWPLFLTVRTVALTRAPLSLVTTIAQKGSTRRGDAQP